MKRIVLAYSGGLEAVRDRALAAGALRAHVLDLREEFARDYVLPALTADAMHEDRLSLAADLIDNGPWFTPRLRAAR